MKKIFLLALFVLVAGCATQKKQENKARNFYLDNKGKLAELSAMVFPVKEEFKPGKQVILKSDTLFLKGDTVYSEKDCPDGTKVSFKYAKNDTVKIYIPILQVDTVIRPDEASLQFWKLEARKESDLKIEMKTKLSLSESKSKNKTYWIIGLSIAHLLIIILWIISKYTQLFKFK